MLVNIPSVSPSSYKSINIELESTHVTSFNHNFLFKTPSPNMVTFEVLGLEYPTCEFGTDAIEPTKLCHSLD